MSMTRIATLALSVTAIVALAGCGGTATGGGAAEPESETAADALSQQDQTPEPADADGDTLVVYFSATGNTEHVAEFIADATGADTFRIEPQEPYTEEDLGYNDDDSRVSRERASGEDVPLVSTDVPGWDSYDTVFFGFPIWWGDPAWPVNGFVTANDFTGKTVVPFCTSGGSGIGDAGEQLATLAGSGDWMEGERFPSDATAEDIAAWINGLNL
ncbi:flavodoxin [uncultured Bifidobacterium sp.]|uniref:flavodoxin n=1 Tax=uncultured Bifidobacterium sp. TaxID=165187 RepID=UPI0025957EF3|nr:flavodoxin [uncultured Bifidobacterium sp.]